LEGQSGFLEFPARSERGTECSAAAHEGGPGADHGGAHEIPGVTAADIARKHGTGRVAMAERCLVPANAGGCRQTPEPGSGVDVALMEPHERPAG